MNATMQPMQLGALAIKSALDLDFLESFHRDLQGRESKKNKWMLLAMSKCMLRVLLQGLFHKPIFLAAVLLRRGLSKGPSFQTRLEKLPTSLEGTHLEAMTSLSAGAEMWIKKCNSIARYESSCLLNTC